MKVAPLPFLDACPGCWLLDVPTLKQLRLRSMKHVVQSWTWAEVLQFSAGLCMVFEPQCPLELACCTS